MARPKKKIDPKVVEALAQIQCTHAEIAAVVGVNKSTILRRFAPRIAVWREGGKMSLRRRQWKSAMGGSDRMLIHLGEQYLGQSRKETIDQNVNAINSIEIIMPDAESQEPGGNGEREKP